MGRKMSGQVERGVAVERNDRDAAGDDRYRRVEAVKVDLLEDDVGIGVCHREDVPVATRAGQLGSSHAVAEAL